MNELLRYQRSIKEEDSREVQCSRRRECQEVMVLDTFEPRRWVHFVSNIVTVQRTHRTKWATVIDMCEGVAWRRATTLLAVEGSIRWQNLHVSSFGQPDSGTRYQCDLASPRIVER